MATSIDIEARQTATQALSRITSHEDECSRRYIESANATRDLRDEVREARGETLSFIDALHKKIDSVQKRNFLTQIAALVSIVGILLSMVAYFATVGTPWQPKNETKSFIEGEHNG